MVCVYCGSATKVINSRKQRRGNGIWRRRECLACGAVFTSHELADLSESLRVAATVNHKRLAPFSRDRLFIDIYESCRHRETAVGDAASLAQTIIDELLAVTKDGIVERATIVTTASKVLKRFDKPAATFYAAYHHV
jgi:transcriptional repressor NrdR